MPLPIPSARKLHHHRHIDCRGYEREDGLWDIEGHLTDPKAFTWHNRKGSPDLPAGVPAHDMWMRLTIDIEMLIHECIAVTDSSPYQLCPDITPKFSQLKGHRIGRGWTKPLQAIIGNRHGCTHQWELLGRIAITAYQTTNNSRQQQKPYQPGDPVHTFNTCHMYTSASEETLRRWPDLYTGPLPNPYQQQS